MLLPGALCKGSRKYKIPNIYALLPRMQKGARILKTIEWDANLIQTYSESVPVTKRTIWIEDIIEFEDKAFVNSDERPALLELLYKTVQEATQCTSGIANEATKKKAQLAQSRKGLEKNKINTDFCIVKKNKINTDLYIFTIKILFIR